MCEWLSCGDWCDVKLVCGGRTFNAHRAVLASVSAFLRRVLLSCPQEDTPTFIVLPDFDLDAMSSVLYYVYNGEVVIEKHKLLLFLDIVKTLEIFIEHQYLQKLRDRVDERYLDLHIYRKSKYLDKVFTLCSGNCKEHECVKIRKGERVQNKRLQYLQSGLDLSDNRDICRNQSDVHPLDNSAPYGGRQRNSFLRDLYIETYPQNGNVNGLSGGVLAISNELYRAPKSVLLTNANGKLPNRVDNRLSETSAKVNSYISFLPNMSRKQRCIQDFGEMPDQMNSKRCLDTHWNSLDLSQSKLYIGNSCTLSIDNRKPLLNYNPPHCYSQLLPRESQEMHFLRTSSVDLSITQSITGSLVPNELDSTNKYEDTINLLHNKMNSNSRLSHSEENSSHNYNFLKAPIFNQVIESPWRPRLPNNYKPFRRKDIDVTNSAPPKKEYDVETVNDNNNNIEQAASLAKYVENASKITGEDFRCAICSQVFTSEDCLTIHMKRHTSPPRYSCGECGKTFSQLRNFKYHMSVHRGTREFAATCTVCGKYFNDRGYLSSHMKIHRNRKEYKCSMCPKSFNQRVAYNMHVRIHTGVKPHVCDECGKAFSRKMLLKQHQRTHSGERPYACPHCDKRFADRSNMTLHLRLHTGVKPFSCSLCPKSFTKKHHLKSHLNFHTGAKPYSCPRCKLAFTQSSNMRTHLKKCSAPEDNTLAM